MGGKLGRRGVERITGDVLGGMARPGTGVVGGGYTRDINR
jgi:hypothetical protein